MTPAEQFAEACHVLEESLFASLTLGYSPDRALVEKSKAAYSTLKNLAVQAIAATDSKTTKTQNV